MATAPPLRRARARRRDHLPNLVTTFLIWQQLLRYGVLEHADAVADISAIASGEFSLEQLLDKIRKGWAETCFVTITNRDQSDVYVLGGVDEAHSPPGPKHNLHHPAPLGPALPTRPPLTLPIPAPLPHLPNTAADPAPS